MSSSEPMIFVLDLDGTIIGDCTYQVMLHNIDEISKKHKVKCSANNIMTDSYSTDSKLIRPFFKYFITNIKKYNPNSHFFVYTASEKTWAQKEINMIEKTHSIKFNRPLFTREDCIIDSFGQYKKSVKKILPRIAKSVKSKQNGINKNNILIIDNNAVFIDYLTNFILCPTYDCLHFCNIWDKISKEHMKIEEMQKFVNNLISTNKACIYDNSDHSDCKILEQKHKWLYKKYKKINSLNKRYKKDLFWKKIANIIIDRRMTNFDNHNVNILHRAISNN